MLLTLKCPFVQFIFEIFWHLLFCIPPLGDSAFHKIIKNLKTRKVAHFAMKSSDTLSIPAAYCWAVFGCIITGLTRVRLLCQGSPWLQINFNDIWQFEIFQINTHLGCHQRPWKSPSERLFCSNSCTGATVARAKFPRVERQSRYPRLCTPLPCLCAAPYRWSALCHRNLF
jgi:hypothetical protein